MAEQNLALVVDDSKSAGLVLKRMLERHALHVDTVERLPKRSITCSTTAPTLSS